MLDPEQEFIIDAVAHAYNLAPSNYADVASAKPISDLFLHYFSQFLALVKIPPAA